MTNWQNIGDRSGQKIGPPLIVTIILVIAWEIVADTNATIKHLLSSPSGIVVAMIRTRTTLLTQHIPQTMKESLVGLLIALIIGIVLAALLDFSPPLRRAVYPLLVVSQTIPIVAIGTVLILIFDFGDLPKVIVVTVFCFFPIAVATLDGLNSTDPDLVALLRAMGASRGQVWRKVRLPAALPSLFSGLRIAATYCIGNAIIAEYVGGQYGIGLYLQSAFRGGQIDQAFAAVVIAAALSIALVAAVNGIERLALPWYFTKARDWNEPGIY